MWILGFYRGNGRLKKVVIKLLEFSTGKGLFKVDAVHELFNNYFRAEIVRKSSLCFFAFFSQSLFSSLIFFD